GAGVVCGAGAAGTSCARNGSGGMQISMAKAANSRADRESAAAGRGGQKDMLRLLEIRTEIKTEIEIKSKRLRIALG
ncbi:MAG: hypothetical protein WAM78_04160, partial [Candidatus Sulfotelmatobacter sp.]